MRDLKGVVAPFDRMQDFLHPFSGYAIGDIFTLSVAQVNISAKRGQRQSRHVSNYMR